MAKQKCPPIQSEQMNIDAEVHEQRLMEHLRYCSLHLHLLLTP